MHCLYVSLGIFGSFGAHVLSMPIPICIIAKLHVDFFNIKKMFGQINLTTFEVIQLGQKGGWGERYVI